MLRIVKISFCDLGEYLIAKGVVCDYCERTKGKKGGSVHLFGCTVSHVESSFTCSLTGRS